MRLHIGMRIPVPPELDHLFLQIPDELRVDIAVAIHKLALCLPPALHLQLPLQIINSPLQISDE